MAALRHSMLGVMVGTMLSPLPLAMVVFGLGSSYLPLAVVAGAVAVTVMTGSFPLATVYLAVDAAPVAMLSRLGIDALSTGNKPVTGTAMGRTVCWLVLTAFAAVMAGLAMMAGPDGIEAALRAKLEAVLATVPQSVTAADKVGSGEDFSATMTEMIKAAAGLLPGFEALGWCTRAIMSACLAQMMLMRMDIALWPTPAYRGFQTPQWFAVLFGIAVLAAAMLKNDAGFMAGNAAAILSLPLVLQGLAVVHSAAGLTKHRGMWLTVFYVLALVTAGISALLLAGLGVMDQFLQIRSRYLGVRTGGE